jgi:hypothetical protein
MAGCQIVRRGFNLTEGAARELAVIWDLAAAINVGSWRGIMVPGLGQRGGIQVRMTGSEAG